jgi:hypothetical protein
MLGVVVAVLLGVNRRTCKSRGLPERSLDNDDGNGNDVDDNNDSI